MSDDLLLRWAALSLAVYVLAANGLWYWQAGGGSANGLRNRPGGKVLAVSAGILYYVGVPYAALIGGAAMPQQFGLAGIDWPGSLQVGAPLALGCFGLIALLLRLQHRYVVSHYPPSIRPAAVRRAQLSQPWGAGFLLLDTLCLQAHWALYRTASAVYFGSAYAGALGGLALVLIEWLLDPFWRDYSRQPGHADDQFLLLVLAVQSAALSVYATNLWLSAALHALVWLGWLSLLGRWYRPRPAKEGLHDPRITAR